MKSQEANSALFDVPLIRSYSNQELYIVLIHDFALIHTCEFLLFCIHNKDYFPRK